MQKENGPKRQIALWLILSFVLWVISFLGFLTSKFELSSDALSYYDHTKFFTENLRHGIYPLWDPFWYFGASNDFFLRRIGAFNPFYLIIILLNTIGIPFTLAYLWSLAAYYFSGMIAFYLLAMRVYQDRCIAYGGFLMLLFSALGTRLFDSYMMLVTVPLIWFFYFLTAFFQTPRKHFFLGMVLTFMVLAGTYIPIYFLIIFALFLLLFILIYGKNSLQLAVRGGEFIQKNMLLVFLSLLVLLFSLLPAINFFHNAANGQMAFPVRHGNASSSHTLTVPHQALDWGAVEDLMYSAYFTDLRLYKFAVVYVPFFAIILLFLGFIGTINRRAVFLFLLGIVLLCCIVPHGLPFYDLLYHHLFFLKYFRNLHFFLWFFLIPLFVFFALEQWNAFKVMIKKYPAHQRSFLGYLCIIHLAAFIFIWWRNDAIPSSCATIILSLIFWSMMILNKLKSYTIGFILLTLTVLVQPLEVFYYFSLKNVPHVEPYAYDFSYTSFKIANPNAIKPENIPRFEEPLYYVSGPYNFIHQKITTYALAKYLQYKLVLVDHLEVVDRNTALVKIEHNFSTDSNRAVVFNDAAPSIQLNSNDPHPLSTARHLDSNSPGFRILSFDANHLRLLIKLPFEKFLIYNDSYDPYWSVSVNHIPSPLYETNGAFKGVWLPSGTSIVEFSYGTWWQYLMNILLSVLTLILLAGIIYYASID